MAIGFMPLVVSIAISELFDTEVALYAGTAFALLLLFIWHYINKGKTPHFTLYSSIGILTLYSLLAITRILDFEPQWFPFLLEVGIVIPLMLIYQFREKITTYLYRKNNSSAYKQAAESCLIAIRVLLLFAFIHFIIIVVVEISTLSVVGDASIFWLFRISPIFVFLAAILFNQFGLHYFNKTLANSKYISVVNNKGKVVGKIPRTEAEAFKKTPSPIIRIIPINNGMIYLSRRPETVVTDKDKIDTPMETFLQFDEKVEAGVKRLMERTFQNIDGLSPQFVIKHSFKTEESNRLIFLFTVDITDNTLFCNSNYTEGKLWSLSQIEQNLDKNYFSDCFEQEYDLLLRDIIDIRERYKES